MKDVLRQKNPVPNKSWNTGMVQIEIIATQVIENKSITRIFIFNKRS